MLHLHNRLLKYSSWNCLALFLTYLYLSQITRLYCILTADILSEMSLFVYNIFFLHYQLALCIAIAMTNLVRVPWKNTAGVGFFVSCTLSSSGKVASQCVVQHERITMWAHHTLRNMLLCDTLLCMPATCSQNCRVKDLPSTKSPQKVVGKCKIELDII